MRASITYQGGNQSRSHCQGIPIKIKIHGWVQPLTNRQRQLLFTLQFLDDFIFKEFFKRLSPQGSLRHGFVCVCL